jgi:capsular polysaccharide biosynthesis protein
MEDSYCSLTGIYVGEREKEKRKEMFVQSTNTSRRKYSRNIQGNIQSKRMQHNIIKNMNIQILVFTTFQYIHNRIISWEPYQLYDA